MTIVAGIASVLLDLVEDAAVAIAAGAVVGTFGGAATGFVRGWSRKQVERDALRDGHIGASFVMGIWVLDLCNV